MSGVHHAMSGAAAAALGVKTLKEVVFNASGTFTVPTDAIDNKFYVGCTGGGSGGCFEGGENGTALPGAGNGRVSSQLILAPGQAHTVTVGAGSPGGSGASSGASSFGGLLSCSGTNIWNSRNNNMVSFVTGVNGGGNGGFTGSSTASNCPAMFTLEPGAIDNTNKFYTAKSYAGGANVTQLGGGGGCYGVGTAGIAGTPPLAPAPNTGAGTGASGWGLSLPSGGSGKVVIYYYAYE